MSERLLDGRVVLVRSAIAADRAAEILDHLLRETPWLVVRYENAGHPAALPRWTVNYGERSYDYSGLRFEPLPWTPLLAELKAMAEELAEERFNALIVQLYRDGEDGVNWHADDSPLVGRDPVIVSLSFGATRRFSLKPKRGAGERLELTLAAGDALVMRGDLQHAYVHKVPREPEVRAPRINLTFRAIRGEAPQAVVEHSSVRKRWPEE